MAKMIDLFGEEPRLKFNKLDSKILSPDDIWADYDELTDSVIFYFTGKPVPAISVYLRDDVYAMVDPDSQNIVGIHVEAFERNFLSQHPLLQSSWPHVKQSLSKELDDEPSSLLKLFSFGMTFMVDENYQKAA